MYRVILVHSSERKPNSCSIYADLEVGDYRVKKDRMPIQELFDQNSCEILSNTGFLIGKDGMKAENQFMQFDNRNRLMLDSLRFCINTNLARAIFMLNEYPRVICHIGEIVFVTMKQEIMPFYNAIQSQAIIKVHKETKTGDYYTEAYQYKNDGYQPWGLMVSQRINVEYDFDYYLNDESTLKQQACPPTRDMSKESRSGNSHLMMTTPKVEPMNGISYQCVFLEYLTQEANALLGIEKPVNHPIRFFDKPESEDTTGLGKKDLDSPGMS